MSTKTIFIVIGCVLIAAAIIYMIAQNIQDNTVVAITEGQQSVINTINDQTTKEFVSNLTSKKNKMSGLPLA